MTAFNAEDTRCGGTGCNHSNQDAETERSGIQSNPRVLSELEASMGYSDPVSKKKMLRNG